MVTQIAHKTEGPHGLPSGRRTEVGPLHPGLIILTVYDYGRAFQSLERSEPVRERIDSRRRRVERLTSSVVGPLPPRLARDDVSSLAGHALLFRKSVPGRDRARASGVPC
jgi:hypothetical protein